MKPSSLRISPIAILACLPVLAVSSLLTGCTNMVATAPSVPIKTQMGGIKGLIHGGRGPVVGANIYLYSPSLTGYGGSGIAASSLNASTPLLDNSVPSTCGAGATATAIVDTNPADSTFGWVTGFTVITGGAGYTANGSSLLPTVTITDSNGGTGSGATGTAVLGTYNDVVQINLGPGTQTPYTAPVVTITPSSTSPCQDANGNYYVSSDANGNFSLSGDYTCTAGLPVYAYTLGGNSGSQGAGGDGGFMSVLGICPASGNFATQLPYLNINELTTVAAAYALAGFATDPKHIGVLVQTSASSAVQAIETTGLTNAFNTAGNLYNVALQQSSSPTTTQTASSIGTIPNTKLNTLADILANCVDSVYINYACETLLSYTPGQTDTAGAAIYIAQHPASNVSAIFNLVTANGSPWQPLLTTAPSDWSLTVKYSSTSFSTIKGLAMDNSDNLWVLSNGNGYVTELSPLGVIGTNVQPGGAPGFPKGGSGLAWDLSGNLWFDASSYGYLIDFAPPSTTAYGFSGFKTSLAQVAIDGNGNAYFPSYSSTTKNYVFIGNSSTGTTWTLTGSLVEGTQVAIDSNNTAWFPSDNTANTTNAVLYEFQSTPSATTPTISAICTTTGNIFTRGSGVAIDSSNNVWVSDGYNGNLVEFNNANPCTYKTYYHPVASGTTLNGVAIDGSGNVFAVTTSSGGLVELSNSGTLLSETGGYATGITGTLSLPVLDASGNVWFASSGNTVNEVVGIGSPVTPLLATAVSNKTIATKP